MINLRLKEAKRGFFDRDAVISATTKAERRVLSKFGAYVRTRARTSIRPNKGTSLPGSQPYSHVGYLRRMIFFSFDQQKRSVVIGPVLLNARNKDVPSLLEYGGTAARRRWGKERTVFYAPRPYMRPAFEEEVKNVSKMWKDSVR